MVEPEVEVGGGTSPSKRKGKMHGIEVSLSVVEGFYSCPFP